MDAATAFSHDEEALQAWLAAFEPAVAIQVRSLAHAWAGGGGRLEIGKLAVRLLPPSPDAAYTVGFLHAATARGPSRLELCRVLVARHTGDDAWVHWSDELVDLAAHSFDPAAKYPEIPLAEPLPPAALARLVVGLRDLALLTAAPTADREG